MAERMAALEKKLTAMTFDDAANEVVITGANLRIVNGLGDTNTTNGLGNLIVGYRATMKSAPPQALIRARARTMWWWGEGTISQVSGVWWSARLTRLAGTSPPSAEDSTTLLTVTMPPSVVGIPTLP